MLLHLTAQRKTSKIMKIISFLQRFSLEISIISNFWILWNSIKSLWYSTNKFSIFRKLLKKLLLVAFSIRKSIITNVYFSYNYHKTPLITHWKLTIIMWIMNLFGLYSVVNHWQPSAHALQQNCGQRACWVTLCRLFLTRVPFSRSS